METKRKIAVMADGRTLVNDESLRSLHHLVAGNGNSGVCWVERNNSCTNSGTCMMTINTGCTNTGDCTGSENRKTTQER